MTTLTFDEIKKRVGKNIKRYDDTNGWKASNTDVTEQDVADIVNEIYQNDLAPLFINKYPQDFRVVKTASSWIANGIVAAGSTGQTLITTGSVFSNSMVGLYVYNDTDSSKTKITGYTNGTTVTVESTIGDTWDGDTIYVLGQEFSFGGDATNIYQIESVGIKYNSTDTYYRKATLVSKDEIFRNGWEVGTTYAPVVYQTTLTVGGILTSGIGVVGAFQNKVSQAIELTALIMPGELSGDNDIPRIPTADVLIAGATKKGYELKQEFDKANYWATQYEILKKRSVSHYVPRKFNFTSGIRAPRRVSGFFSRRF